MKRRRFLLAALALVLVIAAGSVYWFWLRGADETIATITLDGEVIAEYDLSQVRETETFTVGAPGAENTIRVSPEGIAVIAPIVRIRFACIKACAATDRSRSSACHIN